MHLRPCREYFQIVLQAGFYFCRDSKTGRLTRQSHLQEILDIGSHLEILTCSLFAPLTIDRHEEPCEMTWFCGRKEMLQFGFSSPEKAVVLSEELSIAQ